MEFGGLGYPILLSERNQTWAPDKMIEKTVCYLDGWKRASHLPGLLFKSPVNFNSTQPVWTEAEHAENFPKRQKNMPGSLHPEKLCQDFPGKHALGRGEIGLSMWKSPASQPWYHWTVAITWIGNVWKWGLWPDVDFRPQSSPVSLLFV